MQVIILQGNHIEVLIYCTDTFHVGAFIDVITYPYQNSQAVNEKPPPKSTRDLKKMLSQRWQPKWPQC